MSPQRETNNNHQYHVPKNAVGNPKKVARHLAGLAVSPVMTINIRPSTSDTDNPSHSLLHHGWLSRQIPYIRTKFGTNVMNSDDDDDDDGNDIHLSHHNRMSFRKRMKKFCKQQFPFIQPIISAFSEQMKEPLIIMLLFSAVISVALGNTSDAISIGIALF